MAIDLVEIGTNANDGTGDPIRNAFTKVNDMFTELYSVDAGDVNSIAATPPLSASSATGDVTLSIDTSGLISGNGTTDKIPLFTGTAALGDSVIAQDGTNIGIGTTAPAVKLEVIGSVTSGIRLKSSEGASNGFNIYNNSASDTAVLSNHYAGPMVFETTSTEQMRIDANGNVGIGTNTAADKLSISSSTNQIGLDSGDIATYGTLDLGMFPNGAFIGTQAGSNAASDVLRFGTGGTVRINVDSTGQIKFNAYTSESAFTGDAVANLAVDSSGNIITDASPVPDDSITYAKLGTEFTTAQTVPLLELDFSSAQVFTKAITVDSTFTFTNVGIGMVKDLILSGNAVPTFPSGTKIVAGTYSATADNLIQIVVAGTDDYWLSISQEQ